MYREHLILAAKSFLSQKYAGVIRGTGFSGFFVDFLKILNDIRGIWSHAKAFQGWMQILWLHYGTVRATKTNLTVSYLCIYPFHHVYFPINITMDASR